ncbi:flagellar filament capping protein FliD [Shewanella salipaludis]|uniref:Flagellar hook-associated protein 2 n=1 Tax=Shewanella salipaludis TaxID=2723052 RepID=A0A972FV71_9GAMM|nr:flagellar filament capping protein FliD [Shewanella salipaludis]NMH66723.1 flagellar filament capping protein FliD [Shewanella salipaludis]
MISGMNAAQFAQQLISADRMGKDQLFKNSLNTYNTKLDAYKLLESSMKKLTAKLTSFDTEAFKSKTASISDDKALVTVKTDAPKGIYDLSIHQLAQAQQLSKSYATEDELLPASGVLSIQLGADVADRIEIDLATVNGGASITVAQLRDLINKDAANPGVQASLVRTGGQIEFMLSANESGAANSLTVQLDGVDWGMTERRAAQDAQLTLNGIDISSASNYLENVVDGVTLELTKTHVLGESSTIKVEDDSAASSEAVKDFVESFNGMLTQINQLTRSMGTTVLDSEKSKDGEDKDKISTSVKESQIGVLKGDSSIRMLQARMRDSVFAAAPNGMRLSDIGIEMGRDGKLQVDETKLTEALKNDPGAVQAMFTDGGSYVDRLEQVMKPFTEFNGFMDMKEKTLDSQIDRVEDNMARHDHQMEQRYQIYLAQFTAMEATINQLSAASDLFQ